MSRLAQLPVVIVCALIAVQQAIGGIPSADRNLWVHAASGSDIDAAFARSREHHSPLLLYWGATWCPPCNQLRATLFNRHDFVELSKSFVPVYVDGDRPGAQRIGQRFKVSAYPTMVVFGKDGKELTRLPGEVEPEQVLATMRLALAAGRSAKAVLADALAGKALVADEWRLLAFYSWDTDDERLVAKGEVAGTLTKLAVAAQAALPASGQATSTRLWLKVLAASDDGKGVKADAALRARVLQVLADPVQSRVHADVIGGSAADIARVLSDDSLGGRAPVFNAFDAALRRLQADATLSRADQLSALASRVELARFDEPKDAVRVKLAEPLLREVREQAALLDREVSDPYERQAVIPYAAQVLGLAGLWPESDALLLSNLARSHAPYYLMSQLASNARKLGRNDEALRWYRQAFERSEGPATRLQWGASYVGALVDLMPGDAARIEQTATQLFGEAAKDPGSMHERSARSLRRIGNKLRAWNKDGSHAAEFSRLQARLQAACAQLPVAGGQRAACRNILSPASKADAIS